MILADCLKRFYGEKSGEANLITKMAKKEGEIPTIKALLKEAQAEHDSIVEQVNKQLEAPGQAKSKPRELHTYKVGDVVEINGKKVKIISNIKDSFGEPQRVSVQPIEKVTTVIKGGLRRGAKGTREVPDRIIETAQKPYDISPFTEVGGEKGGIPFADTGGYADLGKYAREAKTFIEMPEIVEFARDINKGKYPSIKERLRRRMALGLFKPKVGGIDLRADIFKDPIEASKVIAHEVGHLVDWLPDKDVKRGNVLGSIASLHKYFKKLLKESPDAEFDILTRQERITIRKEALRQAKEHGGKLRNTVSAQDILDVWNTVDKANPELTSYIAKLSASEKVLIAKDALRGKVPKILSDNFSYAESPIDVRVIYEKAIKEEIIKRKLWEESIIKKELKDLSQIWKPFDEKANPNLTKYRYHPRELYADAFSVLINNPELLKEKAPNFHSAFFSWLSEKPEVKALYDDIQMRMRSPEEVLKQRDVSIKKMFESGEQELAKAARGTKLIISDIKNSLKKELIDVNAKLIGKIKQLDKMGVKLPPEKNPRYWIEELPYTSSEFMQYLRDVDKNIKQPAKKVGVSDADIGKYMMLKRITTERAEIANPLGHTKETAIKHLEYMKRQIGDEKFIALENIAKDFQKHRLNTIIPVLEKAKILDTELMEKLKNNDFYATFDVQHYIEKRYGRNITAQIYKQIGTLNEINNPFVATIMKDAALLRAANRKMTAFSIVDMHKQYFPTEIKEADTRWNGRYREPIEPKDPELGMIAFAEEGKIKAYYVHKEIAESLSKDPYEAGIILKTLSAITQPLKEIFVSKNPFFLIWNIQRDIKAFAKQLPEANLLKAIKYSIKALPDAFKDVFRNMSTEDVAKMYKDKSLIVGRYYAARDMSNLSQMDRLLIEFGLTPSKYNNLVLKPFKALWNFLDKPGQFSERVTKIAGLKYLKDMNKLTDKEKAHIVRTRAGSPDFKRAGHLVQLYNNIFLFSNAGKEGLRSAFEAYKEKPSAYIWKTVKYDVIPKLIMYGAGIGLLGQTIKKMMDDIPERDKSNYITIPIGKTENGKTAYFVMPHDFQGQVLGGLLWQTLNAKKTKDISAIVDYMAGGIPYSGLNPIIGVTNDTIQYLSGKNPYDSWGGRQVVPDVAFEAGGWYSNEYFLKYIANQLGSGSLVHRFKTDDVKGIKGELETLIGTPVAGRLVERFIRISNEGLKETLREAGGDIRQQNASDIMDVRNAIIKLLNKEPLTEQDKMAILKKPELIDDYILKYGAKQQNSAILQTYLSAKTKAEKEAIVQKAIELGKQPNE